MVGVYKYIAIGYNSSILFDMANMMSYRIFEVNPVFGMPVSELGVFDPSQVSFPWPFMTGKEQIISSPYQVFLGKTGCIFETKMESNILVGTIRKGNKDLARLSSKIRHSHLGQYCELPGGNMFFYHYLLSFLDA